MTINSLTIKQHKKSRRPDSLAGGGLFFVDIAGSRLRKAQFAEAIAP